MDELLNCTECREVGTLNCTRHGEVSPYGRGLNPDGLVARVVRVVRRRRPATWPRGMVRPITRRQPPRDTGTPPRAAP